MHLSRRIPLIATALLAAGLPLGGCDSFNRAIGKEKVVPDEFAVVSRAPLAIPPDYSLRPPRIGALRPQEAAPVDQARQTVFRAGEAQTALPPAADQRSSGEGELLREAGAGTAPPNIRQLVDTEAATPADINDSIVDKLAFWRSDQKLGSTDAVIDPNQEAARLQDVKNGAKPTDNTAAARVLDGKPTIDKEGAATSSSSSSSSWFGWVGNLF
jgi:hypothetical protein